CARIGEVDVRLVGRGPDAGHKVAEAEKIVRQHLDKFVFGIDDDSLEAVVVRLLTERKQTLGLAESCTGGFISNRLTNVPGASVVFNGGLVTYSNEAKQTLLGVRKETLDKHGAVSEAIASEMAEGARRRLDAHYAIAVTGIAGPGGGTDAKPVGTVWIGVATPDQTLTLKQFNPYERETFKYITSQQALNSLRRQLL